MSRMRMTIGAAIVASLLLMLPFGSPRMSRATSADGSDEPGRSDATTGAGESGGEDAPPRHEWKIDDETQTRLGLAFETLRASEAQPLLRALGAVEDDPAQTFTLRAPLAGYLRPADQEWPALGAIVAPDARLALLQPRLTPVEAFALQAQLADARAAVAEIETEQLAAQASYESKRQLNAEGKVVSDRQFEDAEARLRLVQARLQGSRDKLALLERQDEAVQRGLEALPLIVESGGMVVELLAAPGEAVESGQPLLRLRRPGGALVRVELPLGANWTPVADGIGVAPLVDESQMQKATLIGPSPRSGAQTRGQAWLLRWTSDAPPPGTPVLAFLPRGGEPLRGLLAPSDALIRYGGLTWVFIRGAGGAFERRAVELLQPTADGWLVAGDVTAGESVVTRGAQLLLSEQLKSQIEAEAEAAE